MADEHPSEAEQQEMARLDIAPAEQVDRLLRAGIPSCQFCRHPATSIASYLISYSLMESVPSVGYLCDRCSSVEEMAARWPGASFSELQVERLSAERLAWMKEGAALYYSDEPGAHERYLTWLAQPAPAR